MMKQHAGINQDTFQPVISITNRYRNYYRRGCLKVTLEDIMRKPRPWLLIIPSRKLI
jgi:hypothetical protein